MEDCIFCKIIKGKIPCYKVYEDDNVLAFLDINPLSKGHYPTILDIPSELMCGVQKVVKKVAEKIHEKYMPSGIFINQNNGEKAGQGVFHYHVHVKPIYDDTSMHDETKHRKEVSVEEMLSTSNDLRIC